MTFDTVPPVGSEAERELQDKQLGSTSSTAVLEIATPAQDAHRRGAVDFNFFAGLCIPEVYKYAFPPYYVALFNLIVRATTQKQLEKLIRYAIGLPRGFVKTTFLKILVVYLVVYDKINFILIVCATEPHAIAFLDDVHEILSSPNIEAIYGKWADTLAIDQTGLKKTSYHRRLVILRAVGAGTSVRGIVYGNLRPDFILCDDMQTKENDESDTESAALFLWFVGTLLKCGSREFCLIIYVGNMYSDRCILFKLKENSYWISLITGCILEDGTSLWPELATLEDLLESFRHDESLGAAHVWFAEMMNDPIESINSLIRGAFPKHELGELIPAPTAAFITVDPAGFRAQSDDNVITAHYLIDGKGYVAEMDGGIWDPGQTCENAIAMALRHEANLIGIEDVAYQQSLQYWMGRVLKDEKIEGIHVVPIKRGLKSKESHIRLFIKELYASEYFFLREQDRQRFVWQGIAYRIGKKKNKDDWLDSPSMGLEIRNTYWPLLSTRRHLVPQGNAKVVGNNTPF